MDNTNGDQQPGFDAFAKFWSDAMSRMAQSGMQMPFPSGNADAMKQMRNGFLHAWANYCDEFMRSEQFLQMMKQSMDNALLFRQQMNQFLTSCLEESQIPSRNDTDALMRVLRSTQERVLERIDHLNDRIDRLEKHLDTSAETNKKPAAKKA